MSLVAVTNVSVRNNPCSVREPFIFDVRLETIEALEDDLDWKIVYIVSSDHSSQDQELDSFPVGPIEAGVLEFSLEVDAPDLSNVPADQLIGMSAILIVCEYRGQEFVRIGYYVNTRYTDPELADNPPDVPQWDSLVREVLVKDPRVTEYSIDWGTG